MDYAKDHLTEWIKYYEIKAKIFFMENRVGFDILWNEQLLHTLALHLYPHKIKYAIDSAGKPDKNHNNKEDKTLYIINEVLRKFNLILHIPINKTSETFLGNHMLGYLREFDYGIESNFTEAAGKSVKLDFSLQVNCKLCNYEFIWIQHNSFKRTGILQQKSGMIIDKLCTQGEYHDVEGIVENTWRYLIWI